MYGFQKQTNYIAFRRWFIRKISRLAKAIEDTHPSKKGLFYGRPDIEEELF
jgi:hypothetical protein